MNFMHKLKKQSKDINAATPLYMLNIEAVDDQAALIDIGLRERRWG